MSDALARWDTSHQLAWAAHQESLHVRVAAQTSHEPLAREHADVAARLQPEARSRLFLAALTLHREFLAHVPKQVRQSLHGAYDVVTGASPRELGSDAVADAWRALFFLVPVVSSTFASFDRVFRGLGAESLGWLLIDEAGQATPQNPVGAIWRARRTVVVGDPIQLEPVVTLPFRAQQSVRRTFGVSERWLPAQGSAQSLADRLNRWGTTLSDGEGPIWVGAPLRVHRRCDDPMFTIVNTIAYDGTMLHGRDPSPSGPLQSVAVDARHGTVVRALRSGRARPTRGAAELVA